MKKTVFYLLCMLLLWSCGQAGTGKDNLQTAAPAAEVDMRVVPPAGAHDMHDMQTVKVTQRSLEHIIARHWSASKAEGAGKFAKEITVSNLKEMIETTAAQGAFRSNTNGRPGKIAEYDFKRAIGTTINGSPATRLRVVIAPDGYLITAFPY